MKERFVYVTYIRTTPAKLWEALTLPEFNKQFWSGAYQVSDWKTGSSWTLMLPDGRVADAGEILEVEKHKRIVIRWHNEAVPRFKADGWTRCTYELEQDGDTMKLSVIHEAEAEGPHRLITEGVVKGWPIFLSSLKSLLETGTALPRN